MHWANLPDSFISHQTQPQHKQYGTGSCSGRPQTRLHRLVRPRPFMSELDALREPPPNMNELDALRVRTIQLETELRLTKEQLLQAQSGTQYLVNCFANQQFHQSAEGGRQNGWALKDGNQQLLQTEIHRPQGELQRRSRPTSDRYSQEDPDESVSVLKEQRDGLLQDVLRLLKEDAHAYSFEYDFCDPRRFQPLQHFKDKVAAMEKEPPAVVEGDLLGGEDLGSVCGDAEDKRVDSPVQSPSLSVKKPSIYIKPGDIGLLDLSPAEQAKYERHAAREAEAARQSSRALSPTPHHAAHNFRRPPFRGPLTPPFERRERRQFAGPLPFAPFEHNHLMANATFLEEKDVGEYLEFFESIATSVRYAGRHTKEQWRSYYEKTVRPMFLEKMARRGAPVGQVREKEPVPEKTAVVAEKAEELEASVQEQSGEPEVEHEAESELHSEQPVEEDKPPVIETKCLDEAKVDEHAALQGMKDSQWAAPQHTPIEPQPQNEPKLSEEFVTTQTAQPVVQAPNRDATPMMPSIPAFGSFDLRPAQASSESQGPIPGLAGGWPTAPPRQRKRSGPSAGAPTAEKDPGTWYTLFSAVQQKSEKHFALGKHPSHLRTVIITGIPPGTKLLEVLEHVRGGKIVSANFFDTAGMKTTPSMTTNTAIIEFLGSQRAKAFVEYCGKHQLRIAKGGEGESAQVDVQLVATQTKPLPQALLADLLAPERALTRVFFLIFVNAQAAPAPEAIARGVTDYAVRCNYSDIPKKPLRITVAEDGMLLFEYADVRQAAAAWNAIAAMEWRLGEVSKGFAADPCGRNFERVESGDLGEREGKEAKEGEVLTSGKGVDEAEIVAEADTRLLKG